MEKYLFYVSIFNLVKATFSNSDLDLLETKLRTDNTEKDAPEELVEESLEEGAPKNDQPTIVFSPKEPPCAKVISAVEAPEGGKIVSIRNSNGLLDLRIEYTKEQILRCGQSPLSILVPASIKEIATSMPEILATFPTRHGQK